MIEGGECAAEKLRNQVEPRVVQIAAEDEGRADEARRVEETARNVASAANDYNDRETCSVRSNPRASEGV